VPLDQTFLPQILRDSGYRTGYIGKWHLNGGYKHAPVPPGEERLGFEHFVGFSRGHRYSRSIYYRGDAVDQPLTSRRYEPDYQTDQLIEFMQESIDDPSGKPFFAMICYGPPHPPFDMPPHYESLYAPDEVPIRANVREDAAAQEKARAFTARYYGLVSQVDQCLGRVLDWIENASISEQTLVLVVSDHGEMAGEHELYGKKTFFEASMRVPLIVRYPARFEPGRVVRHLVDPSVDTMPTLLELCDIALPDGVQGSSYLSLLDGGDNPVRQHIFYEVCMEREGPEAFPVPERGVRSREWLYVRTEQGPKALYYLPEDPLEMNNLFRSADHRESLDSLDDALKQHMERTGDSWGIEAVFPPPDFQTHAEGAAYADGLLEKALIEP
jgi:arylsulfatase A-like enzyme